MEDELAPPPPLLLGDSENASNFTPSSPSDENGLDGGDIVVDSDAMINCDYRYPTCGIIY